MGGSLSLLTTVVTHYLTSKANRESEVLRTENAAKAESQRLPSRLIKFFVSTGNAGAARDKLGFLIDSGLIPDHEQRIKKYLADRSKPTPKLDSQTSTAQNASAQLAAACPKPDLSRPAGDAPLKLSLDVATNRLDPAACAG